MEYLNVGIDVGAEKLNIAAQQEFEADNTPPDHQKLIQRLTRSGQLVRVCMGSTGVYGLDLAVALHRAEGIEVMVLNPRVARRFAEALWRRSKAAAVDARGLQS